MTESTPQRSTRRSVETLGKGAVSGLLILYVIQSVDVEAVWKVLLGTDAVLFFGAAVASLANPLISSKKLDVLLRAKARGIPFRSVVSYYYIGKFFNAFLPATIGGDAVKAHLLAKDTDHFGDAYSSVFMERFVGLLAIVGLGTVASLATVRLLPRVVYVILFGVYVPSLVLLSGLLWWDGLPAFLGTRLPVGKRVTSSSVARKLVELYESIHEFKNDRKPVSVALSISILHQTIVIVIHFILAEAIGMSVALHYFFVLIPISTIIVFLPISIAGIGVQEAAFVFLFSLVGGAADQAVSLSLLVHSLTLFPVFVGGIAYLMNDGESQRRASSLRRRQ